jgi:hypothetical protein
MSTRCQIGFYEEENTDLLKPDILLYRHSDGYPGTVNGKKYGVLTDLVPFLKLFHKRRSLIDIEYAAAWTLHHLISIHVENAKDYYKDHPNYQKHQEHKDGIDCLENGICKEFHRDIEYYYAVQGAKLTVYEVNLFKEISLKHFKRIKTIVIK